MTKRHHRSVYIPAPLEKALQEHPEINISQVCKVALEVATGIIQTPEAASPEELPGTMSGKLSDIEAQLRTNVSILEKIARLAATQAGMVVLTQEEAEIYRGILKMGINQFVYRMKQEAINEYKQEIARNRKRKSKTKNLHVPEQESAISHASHCVDCGDPVDAHCRNCGAPLCWLCWTGPVIDAPARETCQKCTEAPATAPH